MLLLSSATDGDCRRACNRKASPVCVTQPDGTRRSYASRCVAEQCYGARRNDIVDVDCADLPCACPLIYAPVCGENGHTYASSCVAACSGVTVASDGDCSRKMRRQVCACTSDFTPVCATNGLIYTNECQAGCAGYRVDPTGSCGVPTQLPVFPEKRQKFCACHYINDPVCDTEGREWANKCAADCAGAEITECDK